MNISTSNEVAYTKDCLHAYTGWEMSGMAFILHIRVYALRPCQS